MEQLIALGTGYAIATKCFTTCFSVFDGHEHFLLDTGGGNTILTNLEKVGADISQIHHVFLSHKHTDHILGAVWIIRMVGHGMQKGTYDGTLHFYCHQTLIDGLMAMCRFMLPGRLLPLLTDGHMIFHPLTDGLTCQILAREVTFFDTGSIKDIQYGCRITLQNGKILTFLGDEPYREQGRLYAQNADYLMHEAMCLYRDSDHYHPQKIAHSSVKEACENAAFLGAKALIMHHTEDKQLAVRKALYTAEGHDFFDGDIYMPDDLDAITL